VKQTIERLEQVEQMIKEEEQKLINKISETDQFSHDCVTAMEKDAAPEMKEMMKQAALLALKRKKLYFAYVTQMAGARNTIEAQLHALKNSVANVKILKRMGEGAEAMKSLNEKKTEAEGYVQEQLNHLKEIEKLVFLQTEDGSWSATQQFADAVDCSLDNIQTTTPDTIANIKEKDKVWATVIGLGFMLSRFEKMYQKGKELVSKEMEGVNGVDVEQLIYNAKELYFGEAVDTGEDLEL